MSGGYYTYYQTRGVERPDLHDRAAVDKVWDWCETFKASKAAMA